MTGSPMLQYSRAQASRSHKVLQYHSCCRGGTYQLRGTVCRIHLCGGQDVQRACLFHAERRCSVLNGLTPSKLPRRINSPSVPSLSLSLSFPGPALSQRQCLSSCFLVRSPLMRDASRRDESRIGALNTLIYTLNPK